MSPVDLLAESSNTAAVEAVLFDVDGTLVDSRDAIVATYADAVRELAGDHTIDPWSSVDVEYVLQLPASEVFTLLADGQADRAAQLSEVFQRRYTEREPHIMWFEGAVDVLRALHSRGLALGLVTTKARRRLELHLAAAGVADLFTATISGDETARTKPDPAPVLAVLERIGVPAERALLVGDGVADIVAARAAGVRSVGVAYGFHPAQCRDAQPDHWIETVPELLEVIPDARR